MFIVFNPTQVHGIDDVEIHPDYDRKSAYQDLAVIKLAGTYFQTFHIFE